jgi:hypothetical protein
MSPKIHLPSAPRSERLDFVKYKLAEIHFGYALAALELAKLEKKMKGQLFFRQTVWTSFYVNYAKPFKQRKHRRLLEDIVPTEFRDSHEFVIKLRDKYFAHSDDDLDLLPFAQADGETLFMIKHKNATSYGTGGIAPAPETADRYKMMTEAVSEACAKRANLLLHKWGGINTLPADSWWSVNTGEKSDLVFRKMDPKKRKSLGE